MYRPYGVGTSQIVSLQGVCNNGLPKLLPYFTGSGQIVIPNAPILETNSITIGVWVELKSTTQWAVVDRGAAVQDGTFYISNQTAAWPQFTIYSGGVGKTINIGTNVLAQNTWYYIVAEFNPTTGTANTYLNGQLAGTMAGVNLGSGSVANILVGSAVGGSLPFSGYIGNLQIYNTSLSASEVHTLYIEGIGGVPIQLQNLVGWWPLNSDINDYSGNLNNGGSATGITFNPSWMTTYTH